VAGDFERKFKIIQLLALATLEENNDDKVYDY